MSKALLPQPGGFEGLLPVGGYCDAPDLVVLDRDDGVSSQAQLRATAPSRTGRSLTPPPPPDKVANGLVTTPEAQLGAPVSPAAPTVAEVERIAALTDPVVRNLQITQCYWELSHAFAARTGGGSANWCTFATWASKQAGQTIRREDLARTFGRLFAQSSQVTSAHDAAVASMAEWSAERGPQPIRDAIWKALEPSSAFDRASDAIAHGNRKVFEEIGPEFARLLALPMGGGEIDPSEFKSFRDSLRPGDPPLGQGYLRKAFTAYAAAFPANNTKERAELTLLANLAIGWHEQTRLQPQIAEALDAPFEEPVKLRRDLLRYLPRLHTGLALRLLLELLPGRSTSIKKLLDDLDDGVKRIAHEAVTEGLMTLALPGEVLSLARDVPGAFPADLRTIDNRELRALIARIVPTPDTTRGSGVEDWSNLTERIHFIADLFRVYQERPILLSAPFTAEQVAVIKSGRRPPGQL